MERSRTGDLGRNMGITHRLHFSGYAPFTRSQTGRARTAGYNRGGVQSLKSL